MSLRSLTKSWPLLLVILAALLTAVSYFVSYEFVRRAELRVAEDRANFYRTTLVNALERYDHLPSILAEDSFIKVAASGFASPDLNERLEGFATSAGVEAIYLMDASGLTIAASNHREPITFLGQNYGFRPYFQTALQGEKGVFFAIGATTSRPGYFVAEPVFDAGGQVTAVIAVKQDISELAEGVAFGTDALFVSNAQGIVVVSANDDWRYRTLEPLDSDAKAKVEAARQFGQEPLQPLDYTSETRDRISLDGRRYLSKQVELGRLGWRLHYQIPDSVLRSRALLSAVLIGIGLALALAWGFFVRSQRIRVALANSQNDRAKLRRSNKKLEQEITERRAVQTRLAKAQAELEQASRLAALGHLSASVTHELGQPISAMQNYLAAAEIDPEGEDVSEFVTRLQGIANRMEETTKQLRFFATKGDEKLSSVALGDAVGAALDLLQQRVNEDDISVKITDRSNGATVLGNALRLEQVFGNILRNAFDAMRSTKTRAVAVAIEDAKDMLSVTISDTGEGIETDVIHDLFEPFVTTKASGEGMGLGLAISSSIVKEHGGVIRVKNRDGGGAEFQVSLPKQKSTVDA